MPSPKSPAEPGAENAGPVVGGLPRDPLTTLVLLQDLDLLLRDASDPQQAEEAGKLGFKMEGILGLRAERDALAASLDPRVLRQYEAAAKRYGGRAIVVMKNRNCLGCSGLLPTGAHLQADRILSCQSCGRILYPL